MTDDALDIFAAAEPEEERPGEIEQLPDGVYIGLSEADYFGQRGRLGSSDLIALHKRKAGWWWRSEHNPRYSRPANDAQNFGHALHALLLEGEDAYRGRFVIEPAKSEYPGLLVSTDEIKKAIAKAGHTLTGTSKWNKPQWIEAALAYIPDQPVWDAILDAFDRASGGRPTVTADEAHYLQVMHEIAHRGETPEEQEVAEVLSGVGLAEVTILYTDRRGIRRRARLDKVFGRFDMDLKSLRGQWDGRDLELALDSVIRKGGYDIQRAAYHEARRYLYAFIVDGMENVHGGTAEQRAFLGSLPDAHPTWDWVWLFYQKPDMTDGSAPVLFPVLDDGPSLDRGSGRMVPSIYHLRGLRKMERALDLYQAMVSRFGLHQPWSEVAGLHYTDQEREPRIIAYEDNHPAVTEPVENEDSLLGGE